VTAVIKNTAPQALTSDRLAKDLRRRVRGEVRFSPGDRALYAYDASIFRQPPIGVVIPRDAEASKPQSMDGWEAVDGLGAQVRCLTGERPVVRRDRAGSRRHSECGADAAVIFARRRSSSRARAGARSCPTMREDASR
jgi:hypothetical protein